MAALKADEAPIRVPAAERKAWLLSAAHWLLRARQFPAAVAIATQLQQYKLAYQALLQSGPLPQM